MRKLLFLFLFGVVEVLVAACSSSPTNIQSVAVTSVETIQIQPTTTADDSISCYGWRLHLLDATRTDIGGGWATLSGHLAWENVNVSMQTYNSTFSPYFDENIQAWKNLQVTTDQGYSYPLSTIIDYWLGRDYVPVGYFYRMPDNDLYIKVSAASTGWKISTPCGVLDFAHPETTLKLNTWPNSLAIGATITVDNATMTVDSFKNCGNKDTSTADWVCAFLTFKNTDLGYEHRIPFKYLLVDGEGNILEHDNRWASKDEYYWVYNAGPGQEMNFYVGTKPAWISDGLLLILQEFSTDANGHEVGGEAWPVVLMNPKSQMMGETAQRSLFFTNTLN